MVFRYYLSREADCFQFPWGGCAGNDNMFLTRSQVILASHWLMLSSHWSIILWLSQCLATCDVTHVASDLGHVATRPRQTRAEPEYGEGDLSSHHQRCHQSPEAGPCSDRLTRYYFDGHLCKMWAPISLWYLVGHLTCFLAPPGAQEVTLFVRVRVWYLAIFHSIITRKMPSPWSTKVSG